METVRFSRIGKEDLATDPRNGTFEVTLADGRRAVLSAVDVAYFLSDAYSKAGLPTASVVGRMARVTDDARGLWMDQGSLWFSLSGRVANIQEFGATGDGTTNDAAAIQAAHDALPSDGGTLFFPPTTAAYRCGTTRLTLSKPVTLLGCGWLSHLEWTVAGLTDPGGTDRGVLNIRHATSGSALDYVKVLNLSFDFGGSRNSTLGEGRRGLNIFRANNVEIRGCRFKGGVGEMVGLGNFDTPNGSRAWIVNNFFTDYAQDGLNPNSEEAIVTGNTFITGSIGIEAGRSGIVIAHNHVEDMTSHAIVVSSVTSFAVTGNRIKTAASTDPASTLGCLSVLGGGSTAPSTDGTISGNTIVNTATFGNQIGIYLTRGTSTTDNSRITIVGNTVQGVRNGLFAESLLDGVIADNVLVGDSAAGAGINLGGSARVKRTSVIGNNVRNFAARAVGLTTNGPIQDSSAESDQNVVGWNTQENTQVLGVTGRIDFANGDTTPSVRRPAGIYYVANTGATTISQLDDGTIGQEVTLVFDDANTTITDGGNFTLNGNFTSTAGDSLKLVAQTATVWVEVSRSVN